MNRYNEEPEELIRYAALMHNSVMTPFALVFTPVQEFSKRQTMVMFVVLVLLLVQVQVSVPVLALVRWQRWWRCCLVVRYVTPICHLPLLSSELTKSVPKFVTRGSAFVVNMGGT
jgi:hypothetical protein